MLGDVLLVRLITLIRVGLGMEDVPIVANAVERYGQKVCRDVKKNIVNKGTATNLLIVRVSGISPNKELKYILNSSGSYYDYFWIDDPVIKPV